MEMSNLAPIVLFVYKRPEHTRKTIEALQKNELFAASDLVIFSDNAKRETDERDVQLVREYIRTVTGCKKLTIIERSSNYGLARNIIEGVTDVTNQYGKVIVLEDDLIASPYFLSFMNDGLRMYEDENGVLSIGSLNFFAQGENVPETFFMPVVDCWGWATWKSRWDLFEKDGKRIMQYVLEKEMAHKINLDGNADFMGMLKAQMEGRIDSWAIRWHITAYLHNKLVLYPRCSTTRNIGFGEGATHTTSDDRIFAASVFATSPIKVVKQPVALLPDLYAMMVNKYRENWPMPETNTVKKIISLTKSYIRKWLK